MECSKWTGRILCLGLIFGAFLASATGAAAQSVLSPNVSYAGGFADLASALGDGRVGVPLTPELPGDEPESVVQVTTAGAFYWSPQHPPTFVEPATQHRFALLPTGLVDWVGESLDPPSPRQVSTNVDTSGGTIWDVVAQCESGGNWRAATGNGYWGGLQFDLGSWRAAGGVGRPDQASRTTQIAVANAWLAKVGWGAWPACSRRLGLR